jgi:hypothetical protein
MRLLSALTASAISSEIPRIVAALATHCTSYLPNPRGMSERDVDAPLLHIARMSAPHSPVGCSPRDCQLLIVGNGEPESIDPYKQLITRSWV